MHLALGVRRLLPTCHPPTHTGFSNRWWRCPPCMTTFVDAALWRRETEKPFSTVLTSPPTKCHTTRVSLSKNGTHEWTLGSLDGERQLGNEPLGAQPEPSVGQGVLSGPSPTRLALQVVCQAARPNLSAAQRHPVMPAGWRSDWRSRSRRIYKRQMLSATGIRC